MSQAPSTPAQRGGESAPGLMAPRVVSTHELPARDQFEVWRAFSAPVIDIRQLEGVERGFAATQRVWDLGDFALTRAIMPGEGFVRAWSHRRMNGLDHCCLVVATPRRGARVIGLRSLGRPFEGAGVDADVLTLFAPRSFFRGLLPLIDAAPDVADLGMGAILADCLLSLERRLPEMTPAAISALAETVRAVVAAGLTPTDDLRAAAADAVSAAILERAEGIVAAGLAHPDFGPDALRRALGVSRSLLYRLFEPGGGVARAIQRARLEKARRLLAEPASRQPIVAVAEAAGFFDPSGFSRAFRREYGCSPSDARRAGALGLAALPSRRAHAAPSPGASNLADLLLGLRP